MSDYVNQEIVCADCKEPFTFEAGEQQFFAEKGFTPPKRCKPCRDIRKAQQQGGQQGGQGGQQQQQGAQQQQRPDSNEGWYTPREPDYNKVWREDGDNRRVQQRRKRSRSGGRSDSNT